MVTVGELKEEFSGSEVALEIIENMLEEDENGAYWNSENYNDAGERIKDYNVTSDDIRGQVWDAQRELVRMEINDLMKWGHEDINSLVSQIENIRSIVENMEPAHTLDEFLDMSDLPTEEIPEGLETYPIWACDKAGRCLVGETADEIEDLMDIQIYHANNLPIRVYWDGSRYAVKVPIVKPHPYGVDVDSHTGTFSTLEEARKWAESENEDGRKIVEDIFPHTITAQGFESVEKTAKRSGNSSAVTLPSGWLGHRVLCIRLD